DRAVALQKHQQLGLQARHDRLLVGPVPQHRSHRGNRVAAVALAVALARAELPEHGLLKVEPVALPGFGQGVKPQRPPTWLGPMPARISVKLSSPWLSMPLLPPPPSQTRSLAPVSVRWLLPLPSTSMKSPAPDALMRLLPLPTTTISVAV